MADDGYMGRCNLVFNRSLGYLQFHRFNSLDIDAFYSLFRCFYAVFMALIYGWAEATEDNFENLGIAYHASLKKC